MNDGQKNNDQPPKNKNGPKYSRQSAVKICVDSHPVNNSQIKINRQELGKFIKKFSQDIINSQINDNNKAVSRPSISEPPHSHMWSVIKRLEYNQKSSIICFYCHKQLTKQNVTQDHKIAQGLGGINNEKNRVFACFKCNHNKAKIESRLVQVFDIIIDRQNEITLQYEVNRISKLWVTMYEKYYINLPLEIISIHLNNEEYDLLADHLINRGIEINISDDNISPNDLTHRINRVSKIKRANQINTSNQINKSKSKQSQ